ncbi:uncharacterized protein LOC133172296 [Saccostrea echinata]|uniref:uncharacterized protein LOC133172296 n=1 Tax=Saccostrea echinata TaxID=191078 RepID=UPI002A82C758|nr:uncharacterized protein LOC133172296 [Saccostrea echinata]
MTYIQELRLTGCNLNNGIPANVFNGMQLDYLQIDRGIIASTDASSLAGLTIKKLANVPNPIGGFTIQNAQLTTGDLATNFFSPLTTVVSITVDNANLVNLTSGMFSSNTAVQTINLSRNKFTKVSFDLFSGLTSLSSINMSEISWDCTCNDLWFQHSLSSNYINLYGNILCMSPTSFQYMKWTQYYFNVCEKKDFCFGIPGVVSNIFCYTWHQILFYFLLMIGFTVSAIAVFIVVNVRRKMMQIIREIEAKKKKAYRKVKEALVRGRDGQHAPASTAMYGMKERKWIDTNVP